MKTPKEYQDNLKQGIITEEMFTNCLYSVNKRAKNYRDKAQEYKLRYNRRYHVAVDSQYDKINEFYGLKDRLLKHLKPKCIHKQFVGYETKRVYSYQTEYYNQEGKNIVWENCYYNRDEGEVYFYYYETDIKKYLYFLYYELTTRSFHTPIKNPKESNLEIIEIDSDFTTYGEDPKYLLSPQFVRKVIETLEKLNCKLILKDQTIEFTDRELDKLPKKEIERPTERQMNFIKNVCELYDFDLPELKTKAKAKKWIGDILKEYNVSGDKKKGETEKRNNDLYEDFQNGITYEELSEKYKITVSTVKTVIKNVKKSST